MHRLNIAAVIVVLTINSSALGQSTNTPTSRLNAYDCEALRDPLRISVRVLDDAKRYLNFKKLLEEAFKAKGADVTDMAEMVATLDVRTVREFQGQTEDPTFGRATGAGSTNIEQESTVFLRGNVWSNRDKSIFGGAKDQSEKFSLHQLQVSVSVNGRTDGRCYWQGEVLHDLDTDDDPDALTQKIIPVLARALGKTVRNRPLTIEPR